jgi:glutathione S-transferase
LERNPSGKVPVLEKDGKVLYESAVVCDFLDEVFPQKPLQPKDPYQKAKDRLLFETHEKVLYYTFSDCNLYIHIYIYIYIDWPEKNVTKS